MYIMNYRVFRVAFTISLIAFCSLSVASCGTVAKEGGKVAAKQVGKLFAKEGSKKVVKESGKTVTKTVAKQSLTTASSKIVTNQVVNTRTMSGIAQIARSPVGRIAIAIGGGIAGEQIWSKVMSPTVAKASIAEAINEEVGKTALSLGNVTLGSVYKDEFGAFGIRLESDLQIEDYEKEGKKYSIIFASSDKTTQLQVSFIVAKEQPLTDNEWQEFLADYTADYPAGFTYPEESGILHTIWMDFLSEDESYRMKEWVEESGGVIAIARYITPADRWEKLAPQILSSLKSISWKASSIHEALSQ